MHYPMHQPATEIESKNTNNYSKKYTVICVCPVNDTKGLSPAPIAQHYDQYCQGSVNNKVYDGKDKINGRMPDLTSFVIQLHQGNSAFKDPKQQKATNQKDHSLYRMLFECFEIIF